MTHLFTDRDFRRAYYAPRDSGDHDSRKPHCRSAPAAPGGPCPGCRPATSAIREEHDNDSPTSPTRPTTLVMNRAGLAKTLHQRLPYLRERECRTLVLE